jgi:hypothetical protein
MPTAGPWTLTNEFRTKLAQAGWANLTAGSTFKEALFLSTSNIGASSTTYAGLTNEVANANGYTTGGNAITLTASGTTSVTLTPTTNETWTASGGSVVARFSVIYQTSGDVVAYCLLDNTPADVTITSGNTLTVSDSNPVLTLA